MQLCQKAKINGRVSILGGAPSSNETASRRVGAISRMTRNPAQVISQSKNLCPKVNDGRSTVFFDWESPVAFTRLLYRPRKFRACAGMPTSQRSVFGRVPDQIQASWHVRTW